MKRVILFISVVLMIVFSGCMSQPNPYEKKFIDDAYYQKDYNAFVNYYKKHKKDIDINKKIEGRTALARAVAANDVKKTVFLLKNGANPNEKVEYDEKMISLVSYAIKERSYDVVPYLIKYGAKYDKNRIPSKLEVFVNNLDLYFYIVNNIGFKKYQDMIFYIDNCIKYIISNDKSKYYTESFYLLEALIKEDIEKLKKYKNTECFEKILNKHFKKADRSYSYLRPLHLTFYKNVYFLVNNQETKKYILKVLIFEQAFNIIKQIHKKEDLSNRFDLLLSTSDVNVMKKLVSLGIKPDIKNYYSQKDKIIELIKKLDEYSSCPKYVFLAELLGKIFMYHPELIKYLDKSGKLKYSFFDISSWERSAALDCKNKKIEALINGGIDYLYDNRRFIKDLKYYAKKMSSNFRIIASYSRKYPSYSSRITTKKYKNILRKINEIIYKLENQNPVVYFAKHNNLYLVKKYKNYLNSEVAEKVFSIAIKNNNLEMVKFLISNGYSPTLEVFKLSLNVNPKISGVLYSKLNNKSQALKIAMQNPSVFSEIVKQSNKVISCDVIEKAAMDENKQIINIISKHAQNKVKKCIDDKLKKAYNEIKSISEYHEGAIDLAKVQKIANAYKIDIKEKIAKVENLKKSLYPKYKEYVEELMAKQKKEYEERQRRLKYKCNRLKNVCLRYCDDKSGSDKYTCERYCDKAKRYCMYEEESKSEVYACNGICQGYNYLNGGWFGVSDFQDCVSKCLMDLRY